MDNQVAVTNVYEIVERQSDAFLSSLSDSSISWEKEKFFAIQLLQGNDFLNKIAWNNQDSLRNSIVNISNIGISLNPALKHAYLVPREGRVCLDISYIGMMHLAQKSGSILWGQSAIVRKNDHYENQGIDVAPSHKYNAFASNEERGEIVGAYCVVKTSDGSYLTDQMNIEDLHKVRATSKAFTSGKKCPWTEWEEEMMRKTVVKRSSKYWPSSERLSVAIDVLNDHEGFRDNNLNQNTRQAQAPKTDYITLIDQWVIDTEKNISDLCSWLTAQLKREIKSTRDLTQIEAEKLYQRVSRAK